MKYNAFLIFGPPGSGKGTVGVKLAQTTSLKHLSTGDVFRGLPKSSESGKLFFSYSSAGKLVPDEVTTQIFGRYLEGLVNTNKLDPEKDILLLDGIPRTVAQTQLIAPICDVKHLFVLDIPNDDVIVSRILNRGKLEGRADDGEETVIRNRIAEYKTKTAAVLEAYPAALVTRIDGSKSPDEVFCDTLAAVIKVRKELGI